MWKVVDESDGVGGKLFTKHADFVESFESEIQWKVFL